MKKIIIIGAGVAGMTAGIYGRINGFETEIYEMHTLPGGECTGWSRRGYQFDGCIHWLMGTKPGTKLHQMWLDVGALDSSVHIVNHEFFARAEDGDEAVMLYTDVDRLEKHLLQVSPEDTPLIHELCSAIRDLKGMEIPLDKPMDMLSIIDLVKMSFKMRSTFSHIKKYDKMTVAELASRFKHRLIRQIFSSSSFIPGEYKATAALMALASLSEGDSGWPMGGSLALARRMEKKYLSLGGKLVYKARVSKILVENGRAVGIELTDGTQVYGDYVVSSADAHATLFDMLQGEYLDSKFNLMFTDREAYPVYTSVQVSVGVACDLSDEPHIVLFRPSHDVDAGGIVHDDISIKHYCYEPSFSPLGKSVLVSLLDADFNWWQEAYQEPQLYHQQKEQVAKQVCAAIEERFPQTRGKIEAVDVATPMTYVRYCNAWKGAWMSFMNTPRASIRYLPGNLPGLENFYLAGQWTLPPRGLPGAAAAGRWVIHRLCKQNGMDFVTDHQTKRQLAHML